MNAQRAKRRAANLLLASGIVGVIAAISPYRRSAVAKSAIALGIGLGSVVMAGGVARSIILQRDERLQAYAESARLRIILSGDPRHAPVSKIVAESRDIAEFLHGVRFYTTWGLKTRYYVIKLWLLGPNESKIKTLPTALKFMLSIDK